MSSGGVVADAVAELELHGAGDVGRDEPERRLDGSFLGAWSVRALVPRYLDGPGHLDELPPCRMVEHVSVVVAVVESVPIDVRRPASAPGGRLAHEETPPVPCGVSEFSCVL